MNYTDDLTNQDHGETPDDEETPHIYSVSRNSDGFKFTRRKFLISAAAITATAALGSAGIYTIISQGEKVVGSNQSQDEASAVKLEISLLGGVLMPATQIFTRIWRVANRGLNVCTGACLHISEHTSAEPATSIKVPDLAPGASIDVPVQFTAPEVPGKFLFNWRLQIQDGVAKSNEFPVLVAQDILAESLHPYTNDMDQTWTLTNPDNSAVYSQVHFTQIEIEGSGSDTSLDYIEVQDVYGNVIETISGSYPTGYLSKFVPGTVVQIHFYSNSSVTMWGFAIDQLLTNNTGTYNIYLPFIQQMQPTPTSFVVCTCNTVDVCTCNLVCICQGVCSCDGYCSCDTVCSCVGYCSCNTVCTCDTVCTCQGNHYWYPN